jgi:uncharacterized protein (DUF302 family)
MIVTQGRHPVPDTVARLEAAIAARGLDLVARVDHGPEAVLLIFGDPGASGALMREAPAAGLELPLRMLVWREDGVTRIGFRDPAELAERYRISEHAGLLERLHLVLDGLAAEAEGDGTETGA